MTVIISNEIKILDPLPELKKWCTLNLVISNPEYDKKFRMHLWLGNTPEKLWLFKTDANSLILPFGALVSIYPMIKDSEIQTDFNEIRPVDYNCEVPTYDYQTTAVDELVKAKYGILQSRAGSGKTQIGISLIAKLGCKTLWLTHTADLLTQSYNRAKLYMDESLFGTITAGRINIGTGITFATVQTLAKQDLTQFKYTWDCVIVDECHRCAGSPTSVTQFGKVLNSLACKHKYGLSATIHRADGLIKTVFNFLGEVAYIVPDSAIADKTMNPLVIPVSTGIKITSQSLETDGTLNYTKLISNLCKNYQRNSIILMDLLENAEHYNLILSDRLNHLREIMSLMPEEIQKDCVMVDGTMVSKAKKREREAALDVIRSGEKHFLFASYKLAKEGLDIPRLDRLYLTTPQKDYTIITQSVGRISRSFDGKEEPICYDYVDDIGYLKQAFKKRLSHYKKSGCTINNGV